MTVESMMALSKEDLPRAAEALSAEDTAALVDFLDLKADAPRYQALQLLLIRSARVPDALPYWPKFCAMLSDTNSYRRSIGILLLAENARWAGAGALEVCLDDALSLIRDEKLVTARQAIAALGRIGQAVPEAAPRIAAALMDLNPMDVRETMRKLILMDACRALAGMRGAPGLAESVGAFFTVQLSGQILDRTAKKELRALMAE